MIRNWIRPLFVVGALSLCFFYIWGCSFGSSSGGTVSNPLGATGGTETLGTLPTRTAEEAAVKTVFAGLAGAFEEKNPDKAVAFFSPNVRDSYLEAFKENPNAFSDLSTAIKNASMTFLSHERLPKDEALQKMPLSENRTAEMKIVADGIVSYIGLVKIDGNWQIRHF